MILIKSTAQIDKIAASGAIIGEIFVKLESLIKPGITLFQLDAEIERMIVEKGAVPAFKGYQGFPAASCLSVNNVLIHGIPDKTLLKEGDIVSVDIGVDLDGFIADAARTYPVGQISAQSQRLIDVTKEAMDAVIAMAKPGVRVGDIGALVEQIATRAGYSTPDQYGGHGVGRYLHEEPMIVNRGPSGSGVVLKEGMVIAVEPMLIGGPDSRLYVENDDWAVISRKYRCAHFEQTLALTADKVVVLTKDRR